jgi:hypothetical protein
MRKIYKTPEMKISRLQNQDIIRCSGDFDGYTDEKDETNKSDLWEKDDEEADEVSGESTASSRHAARKIVWSDETSGSKSETSIELESSLVQESSLNEESSSTNESSSAEESGLSDGSDSYSDNSIGDSSSYIEGDYSDSNVSSIEDVNGDIEVEYPSDFGMN